MPWASAIVSTLWRQLHQNRMLSRRRTTYKCIVNPTRGEVFKESEATAAKHTIIAMDGDTY